MKRVLALLCSAMLFAATPAASEAAIQASAYLQISDFVVTNVATNAPLVANLGPGVPGQITVTGTGAAATANATMNGLTDIKFAASLDSPIASSNGVITNYLGAFENTFTSPLATALPYARADSAGSGQIVQLVPGPVGATVQSIADVVVPNTATIENQGFSSNTVTSSTVFFTVTSPITVRFDFDALVDIIFDYTLPPDGLLLTGSTSFEAILIGTGITVGGSTSGSFAFAPAEINTGLLSQSSPGLGGYNFVGSFTSPNITLAPGTYSFSITQGATASVVNAVPEPASMLTWGLLGMCSATAAFRRRLKKS